MTFDLPPSLEVTGDDLLREGDSLVRLPGSWKVFVAHLGGQTAGDFLQDCLRVRQLGHRPVPHLTARRYRNSGQLAETVRFLRDEAAVREVLVLAGDAELAGLLKDSLDVLDSGILEQGGIERVWFSGYPEGHPKISESRLEEAWKRKVAWSQSCRIPIGVVTQLAGDPAISAQWCGRRGFAEQGIAARISQFLLARAEILEDLARLAGMPALLRLVRESGSSAYVRGPAAAKGGRPAMPLCGPHYMALGALGRTVAELSGLSGEEKGLRFPEPPVGQGDGREGTSG